MTSCLDPALGNTSRLSLKPAAHYLKSYFEEEYKDRPDIMQKVFENAPRWTHPDTKEDLWRHTKVSCNAITVHEDTAAVDRDGAKVKAKAEEKSMPPDTD